MSVGRPWVPLGRSSLAWLEPEAHEEKWELRVAGEARLLGGGWGPAWRGGSQAAPCLSYPSGESSPRVGHHLPRDGELGVWQRTLRGGVRTGRHELSGFRLCQQDAPE